jgi:hypothetical protein
MFGGGGTILLQSFVTSIMPLVFTTVAVDAESEVVSGGGNCPGWQLAMSNVTEHIPTTWRMARLDAITTSSCEWLTD